MQDVLLEGVQVQDNFIGVYHFFYCMVQDDALMLIIRLCIELPIVTGLASRSSCALVLCIASILQPKNI